jgi:hypothetical protein
MQVFTPTNLPLKMNSPAHRGRTRQRTAEVLGAPAPDARARCGLEELRGQRRKRRLTQQDARFHSRPVSRFALSMGPCLVVFPVPLKLVCFVWLQRADRNRRRTAAPRRRLPLRSAEFPALRTPEPLPTPRPPPTSPPPARRRTETPAAARSLLAPVQCRTQATRATQQAARPALVRLGRAPLGRAPLGRARLQPLGLQPPARIRGRRHRTNPPKASTVTTQRRATAKHRLHPIQTRVAIAPPMPVVISSPQVTSCSTRRRA